MHWLPEIGIHTQWSPSLVCSQNVPQVVGVALQNRRPDGRDVREILEAVGLLERAAPVPRPLSPWRSHNLRTFGNGAPGGSPEECER